MEQDGENLDQEQQDAPENHNPPEEEPVAAEEQNEPAPEPAEEPRNDLTEVFAEINGNLDELDKGLRDAVKSYSKTKDGLDPDMLKLCANYLLGTSSPVKAKAGIGFLSSRVSPIKKIDNQSPPSAEPEGEIEGELYNGNNNNDAYAPAEPEYEKEESNPKYRDALYQPNFWGRDDEKGAAQAEYIKEEPVHMYKYQPVSDPKGPSKLGYLDKYKAKY